MVPAWAWWPGGRQSEGRGLAAGDEVDAGERHVGGARDGVPGAGDEAAAGVEGKVAELAVDGLGLDGPHARRPPEARQGRKVAALGEPEVPRLFQEGDVVGMVDAADGVEAMRRRADQGAEAARLDRGADHLGALGLLEGRHD